MKIIYDDISINIIQKLWIVSDIIAKLLVIVEKFYILKISKKTFDAFLLCNILIFSL